MAPRRKLAASQAFIWLTVCLTSHLDGLLACGSGTKATGLNSVAGNYFRCQTKGTTTVTCKENSCQSTDYQLSPASGVKSRKECESTTYYQVCYTYSKDSTGLGTCQADYVGCRNTADNSITLVVSSYLRCTSKSTGVSTCRPTVAECSNGETADPFGRTFSKASDCTSYSPSTAASTYIRCVIKNDANCRLVRDGCSAGEIQVPETETYPNPDACRAKGPPLYNLCYDYNATPTSTISTCQLVDVGCVGIYKRNMLPVALNDYTCDGYANLPTAQLSKYKFIRCVVSNTVVNCRPEGALCNPFTEKREPVDLAFPTLASCIANPRYVRCIFHDSANCRLVDPGCLDGETQMPEITGFPSFDECNDAGLPFYDLCYDYDATPTSKLQTCQLIEVGCTGPSKIKLIDGWNDYTCDRNANVAVDQLKPHNYVRCVVSANSLANCRPQAASCKPGAETQNPADYAFPALDDCNANRQQPRTVLCGVWDGGENEYTIPCRCDPLGDSSIQCPFSHNWQDLTGRATCSSVCPVAIPASFIWCKVSDAVSGNTDACFCVTSSACDALDAVEDFIVRRSSITYNNIKTCHDDCDTEANELGTCR